MKWAETFLAEYDAFAQAWERHPPSAWEHPQRLPPALRVIDPYGCEAPGEFFAVASEAFFIEPSGLRDHWPTVYRALSAFYRQDPAG